jgi:hypothetical protein
VSFTLSFRKSILFVGPARASRNLQRVAQKKVLNNSLEIPLKEIFQNTIEYYLQRIEIFLLKTFITPTPKNRD